MKKILALVIISIIIFNINVAAQQAKKELYFPQPDLKRFEGEWVYLSNDTTFIVKLKLVKTYVNDDPLYIDLIQGDYTIKKAGKILQSSVGCSQIKSGGYVDKDVSKDRIHFLFYDLGRKSKSGNVVFELLNANKASWKLTNTEGVRIGYYDYNFSVSINAVFKKIK